MKLEHDDPRVIDYVLGELPEDERREIEAALKDAENDESVVFAREIEGLSALSRECLGTASEQRIAMENAPEASALPRKPERSRNGRRLGFGLSLAAGGLAAMAAFTFSTSGPIDTGTSSDVSSMLVADKHALQKYDKDIALVVKPGRVRSGDGFGGAAELDKSDFSGGQENSNGVIVPNRPLSPDTNTPIPGSNPPVIDSRFPDYLRINGDWYGYNSAPAGKEVGYHASYSEQRTRLNFAANSEERFSPEATTSEAGKPAAIQKPNAAGVSPTSASIPTTKKLLIRNAEIAVETKSVRSTASQISDLITSVGGYQSNGNESMDSSGELEITLELRLPAEQFDDVVDRLTGLGKVLSRRVSAQEVSQEYVDTDARNRNMKKAEERLLDHLEKSESIDATIKLEAELTRVREQIEVMDGRLRYLDNQIAYSTIRLSINHAPAALPITPADSFSTARVLTDAVRKLVGFGQLLWGWLIWSLVWSPVWGLLLLSVFWFVRHMRRTLN